MQRKNGITFRFFLSMKFPSLSAHNTHIKTLFVQITISLFIQSGLCQDINGKAVGGLFRAQKRMTSYIQTAAAVNKGGLFLLLGLHYEQQRELIQCWVTVRVVRGYSRIHNTVISLDLSYLNQRNLLYISKILKTCKPTNFLTDFHF